ncbi:MAG: alpha/beta hydrolase-fold protein, partial [Verrucomicrobiota bacterium]
MPRSFLFLMLFLAGAVPASAQNKSWTPPPVLEIQKLIPDKPAEAAALIRKSWGTKTLTTKALRIEKTTVLWASLNEKAVSVVNVGSGEVIGEMATLNDDGLQALTVTFPNGTLFDYQLRIGDKVLGGGAVKVEHYDYLPDSLKQAGVPQGQVHRHAWNDSKIFPDTFREYLVYIPAQYDGSESAALMVFQDGLRHADPNGGLRATVVFDNLIAKGEMPVTVGVFINPGRAATQKPGEKPRNRGFEYDSLGPAYANFLLQEILPQVKADHALKISEDPELRAIAGGSSGASCAWTAAWERPDQFGKVLGWVGSFVDLRGAHAYPPLIRKTEPKPIRAVFLAGTNDLDNRFGNWPLANRQMEAALSYAKYDFQYRWGPCFHGSKHASAELPEMLRWLWR